MCKFIGFNELNRSIMLKHSFLKNGQVKVFFKYKLRIMKVFKTDEYPESKSNMS